MRSVPLLGGRSSASDANMLHTCQRVDSVARRQNGHRSILMYMQRWAWLEQKTQDTPAWKGAERMSSRSSPRSEGGSREDSHRRPAGSAVPAARGPAEPACRRGPEAAPGAREPAAARGQSLQSDQSGRLRSNPPVTGSGELLKTLDYSWGRGPNSIWATPLSSQEKPWL